MEHSIHRRHLPDVPCVERLIEIRGGMEHTLHRRHLFDGPPCYVLVKIFGIFEQLIHISHLRHIPEADRTILCSCTLRILKPLSDRLFNVAVS